MESVSPHVPKMTTEGVVPFNTTTLVDDVSMINDMLLQLIRTINLKELLDIYFKQLQQYVPVSSVLLVYEDKKLRVDCDKTGDQLFFTLVLPSTHDNKSTPFLPRLHYHFSRKPDSYEFIAIEKLHNVFSHQLEHALHVDKLTTLATKDSLTELGNRAAFDEDIVKQLALLKRQHYEFALLVFDLDNFKAVNDLFGHNRGDAVLIEVANCLTDSLRANDKAYRFGGDEFCCIINTEQALAVEKVIQRVQAKLASSHLINEHGVSLSIGATFARPDDSTESIFKRADEAMYGVKRNGKNGFLIESSLD